MSNKGTGCTIRILPRRYPPFIIPPRSPLTCVIAELRLQYFRLDWKAVRSANPNSFDFRIASLVPSVQLAGCVATSRPRQQLSLRTFRKTMDRSDRSSISGICRYADTNVIGQYENRCELGFFSFSLTVFKASSRRSSDTSTRGSSRRNRSRMNAWIFQRLLESPSNRHYFADGFHLRSANLQLPETSQRSTLEF